MSDTDSLRAFALNCTLKASSDDEPSSTDKLLADMLAAMEPYGVHGEIVRVADTTSNRASEATGMTGRIFGSASSRRTSSSLACRFSWASHPASPSGCWSGWMPSSTTPTMPSGCRPRVRSRLSRWWAMKMVRITATPPAAFRRSTTWASLSQLRGRLLGRGGHEVGELRRPEEGAQGGQRHAGNAGFEHRAPGSIR